MIYATMCDFCIIDSPKNKDGEICKICKNHNKFKLKTRLTEFEKHSYEKLLKVDEPAEFDRKTALMVLHALSDKMYPSTDLFGNKTLVISRYEFEAIRKKFLDKREVE